MARFSRMKTLNTMIEIGVIPVFYTPEIETSKEIVKSLYQGGALCIEMTNRGDGAIDVFKELEKFCISSCPDVILGIGSVIDASTAAMYISYGANFVVGPAFDKDTAITCNSKKIPYSPGCGTVTEIHNAESYGVEICKIFPGKQVGGPEFVKSVKGPCPWTSIMPTGGVDPTPESLKEWFDAGVSCVGIGSNLISKEIIKNKDFKRLSGDVKKVIEIIKDIRNKKKF
jgi:2-dehydro-3-deoxyphosphogluconate aldolase/(4S)-4-hydroxy-2-oxoglutarate aldolase